ncbi:hypothetical protein Salat_1206800 [Sesamum alatum]|uniref:Transposase (putative) gypsy type domain-containing protein n=1 Tax=Sesamum alatum TaxID=300844 RepID=A0AAE1YFE5_9LAMI|nr:hypothetical protein Salat_1206800 [Sesamum alatum]
MDCGYTTSDWTSSGSFFSSPPHTTRSLPQKTRGKMTHRTRASSSKEASSSSANEISADGFAALSSLPPKMSAKSIVKTINLLGLPEGFEIVTPIEYQRANNPPPGCLTVYAAQCVCGLRSPLHPFLINLLVVLGIPPSQLNPNSYRCLCPKTYWGECFFHFSPRPSLMFIHDKPSSYGAWKNSFFFVRKAEWEVPLTWRSSLNEQPSINFELVRERVKAAGLLDHGFKAKALMEEDLLTLAGLHPIPNTYTGPDSRYFRLRNFSRRMYPRIPCPLRVRGQHWLLPPIVRLGSVSPSPPPTGQLGSSLDTPVIEVETSPEGDTTPIPSSPPFVPQVEEGSSSQKRPRVEEVPQREEAPSSDPPSAAASASFPLPVMTPQFNPKLGVSNMCKVANKDDVEFLSGRSMESIGHLILLQTAMLKGGRIQVESLKKQLADEESKSREKISSLRTQLEEKDHQLSVQAMEMEYLRTTSLQSYSRGHEGGLQAGHSTAVATYKASPEYAEEVFRQGSTFYTDGFTVCAEQFKNLGNLPTDYDFNFLDMRADGFGRIGGVGPSE